MNNPTLTPEVVDIQPRIVRRELNLDFGQFFYPQEKRKIFLSRLYVSELTDSQGNKRNIRAKISYHPDYGTLTTFDERVFYVLVEFWQEQGKSETIYFSEREIARRLDVNWTGNTTGKTIRESLTRLRLVGIEWDGSFFHKSTERLISISNPFTILSHLKTFTTKDEGIGSQIAEFRFDERVIQNLTSNYSRPVLLDTVLSFHSPLAQALYTYLEPRMYGTNHYHRTSAGLLIEDLGLQGSIYSEKKYRVRAIKRAREELLGKRFYYDEAITKIEIANGKQDAIFHAYRSGGSKLSGRLIELPHIASQLQTSQDTSKKSQSQNRRKSPSTPQEGVIPNDASKTPPRASQGAYEVLQTFGKVFYNDEQHQFDKNDVLLAEKILQEHGMEKAKYFVRFAHSEASQTRYKVKYFRGIKKYLQPAIEIFERQKRITRRNDEDCRKRKLENARINHEREYANQYHEYIDELLGKYEGRRYEKRFDEFKQWQSQKREETIANVPESQTKLRKMLLKNFGSEGAGVLRLVEFFKGDPEIHIPDFWEWDKNCNPHSFGSPKKSR